MHLARTPIATMLTSFTDQWSIREAAMAALAFDERFSARRCRGAVSRHPRADAAAQGAKLRLPQACLKDLGYAPRRGLDRAVIRQLALGRWIVEHHNLLITGATGVGKTFLACALGQQACRQAIA
jgi:DNA replication protein DnaC